MRASPKLKLLAAVAIAILTAGIVAQPGAAQEPEPRTTTQVLEVPSENGSMTWVEAEVPVSDAAPRVMTQTTVTPIEVNGPSESRIDLVFMGDGYTSSELTLFANQVDDAWDTVTDLEPFGAYRNLFNVWRVDVVSNESGVSGDPTADVERDTELGTFFFCGGIERLLCADDVAVAGYAAMAPDDDFSVVLANSSKYGGAGGNVISTYAAGNPSAILILLHELGHSIGELADEYYPSPGSTYTGPETTSVNTSILQEAAMVSQETKWWCWMGDTTPDGGVISTYEGAGVSYQFGLYRPSFNSIMRSLGQEYNLVGREQMVKEFYEITGVIEDESPTSPTVTPSTNLTVTPVDVAGLEIRWFIDGVEEPAWENQTTVTVTSAHISSSITAEVTDPTDWVLDENCDPGGISEESMTWTVVS